MANIQDELNNIKNALFGKDVRNSIHDGIDAINKEVESTTGRQEHLETTFDQLTINAGNSNAEIVDARVGENGKSYAKLGDRLDSVDSQLEHNMNELSIIKSESVSLLNFGAKCDGITDDYIPFKIACEFAIENNLSLKIPRDTKIVLTTNIKIPSLTSDNKSTLFISDGKFLITNNSMIKNIDIVTNTPSDCLYTQENIDRFTIDNCNIIYHTEDLSGNDLGHNAISILSDSINNISITNVEIKNFKLCLQLISNNQTRNVHLSNLTFRNTRNGILIKSTNRSYNIKIYNYRLLNTKEQQLTFRFDTTRVNINDSNPHAGRSAITMENVGDVIIDNVHVEYPEERILYMVDYERVIVRNVKGHNASDHVGSGALKLSGRLNTTNLSKIADIDTVYLTYDDDSLLEIPKFDDVSEKITPAYSAIELRGCKGTKINNVNFDGNTCGSLFLGTNRGVVDTIVTNCNVKKAKRRVLLHSIMNDFGVPNVDYIPQLENFTMENCTFIECENSDYYISDYNDTDLKGKLININLKNNKFYHKNYDGINNTFNPNATPSSACFGICKFSDVIGFNSIDDNIYGYSLLNGLIPFSFGSDSLKVLIQNKIKGKYIFTDKHFGDCFISKGSCIKVCYSTGDNETNSEFKIYANNVSGENTKNINQNFYVEYSGVIGNAYSYYNIFGNGSNSLGFANMYSEVDVSDNRGNTGFYRTNGTTFGVKSNISDAVFNNSYTSSSENITILKNNGGLVLRWDGSVVSNLKLNLKMIISM